MLTEQERQLFEAAKKGDIGKVKELIGKGADVKAKDEFGGTSLHCAVINGHVEVVKYLIEKGVDINAVDEDGWTALRSAVQNNYNNLELIKTLLECEEIDADIPDNNGLTPLRIAVNCNHKEALQLIIPNLVAKNKDKPDDLKEEYSVSWKECEDELRDMKKYKLDNRVSLFDILTTNDKRKLELHVRNENIVEVFRSNVNAIKDKFPIYVGQIGKQCKKGLERKYAVEKIVDCISRKELDPNEFRLKDLNEYALRKLLEYADKITLEDDKNLLKDLVPPRSNFSTESVEAGQRRRVQC